MKRFAFILTLSLFIGASSCKKNSITRCESLKEAAFLNNIESVKAIIDDYIRQLPSKRYNQQNIELLTQRVSTCDISSSLRCFDCIQTLPSQTEILFNFSYNGMQVQKVIDLSYSKDNRIVFVNMHDQ